MTNARTIITLLVMLPAACFVGCGASELAANPAPPADRDAKQWATVTHAEAANLTGPRPALKVLPLEREVLTLRARSADGQPVRGFAESLPVNKTNELPFAWDGLDDFGRAMPAGEYRYELLVLPPAPRVTGHAQSDYTLRAMCPVVFADGKSILAFFQEASLERFIETPTNAPRKEAAMLGKEDDTSQIEEQLKAMIREREDWRIRFVDREGHSAGEHEIKMRNFAHVRMDAAGNLYGLAENGGALQKIDNKGQIVKSFGKNGTLGGFVMAGNFVVDDRGDQDPANDWLYVADRTNGVFKFDSNGQAVREFGDGGALRSVFKPSEAQGSPPICSPSALAVDSSGNLYIGHGCYKAWLTKVDPRGKPLAHFSDHFRQANATFTLQDDEQAYKVNQRDGGIIANRRVEEEVVIGDVKQKMKFTAGLEEAINVFYRTVTGLAVDRHGNIFVVTGFVGEPGRRVQIYSPRGELVHVIEYRPGEHAGRMGGEFGHIKDVAITPSGELGVYDALNCDVVLYKVQDAVLTGTLKLKDVAAIAWSAQPLDVGAVHLQLKAEIKGLGPDWEGLGGRRFAEGLELKAVNVGGKRLSGMAVLALSQMPATFPFNPRAYVVLGEDNVPLKTMVADQDGDGREEILIPVNLEANGSVRLCLLTTNGPEVCPRYLRERYQLNVELVDYVRCFDNHGRSNYREDASARIVVKPDFYRYRLSGEQMGAWFRYWMPVKNESKPHLLVAEYPDDDQRITVMLLRHEHTYAGGNTADWHGLDGAYQTGVDLTPSGKFLKWNAIVWPRCDMLTLYFTHMTRGRSAPVINTSGAAASRLWLFEIKDAWPVKNTFAGARIHRGIGYDVPCVDILFCEFGAPVPPETWGTYPISYRRGSISQQPTWRRATLRNLGAYCTYMGINFMGIYVWFLHGEHIFPTELVTPQGYNAAQDFLDGFAGSDTEFLFSFMGLSAKPKWATLDHYQMDSSGKVHTLSFEDCGLLDPLHPDVERFYVRLLTDCARRYAGNRHFKGIYLQNQPEASPLYSGLNYGFGQPILERFLTETGLELATDKRYKKETLDGAIPDDLSSLGQTKGDDTVLDTPFGPDDNHVKVTARLEYTKHLPRRANEILTDHKEQWTQWRCKRMTAWLEEVKTNMAALRPDLVFYVAGGSKEQGFDWDTLKAKGMTISSGGEIGLIRAEAIKPSKLPPDRSEQLVERCETGCGFIEMRDPFPENVAATMGANQNCPMAPYTYMLDRYNPRIITASSWMHATAGHDLTLRDFIRVFVHLPHVVPERIKTAMDATDAEKVTVKRYRQDGEDYLVLFNQTVAPQFCELSLPSDAKRSSVLELVSRETLAVNSSGKVSVPIVPRGIACLQLSATAQK